MLLLEDPMRLSTDIDIVVPPETQIENYLEQAAQIFPFTSKEEQVRRGRNNIVKRHFKFFYDSPLTGKPFHILLDVLYENDHYACTTQRPITNKLLLVDDPAIEIEMPTADCILGDKLTAFAPHTTGISLGEGKDLEVIKQMYDISTLLSVCTNFSDTKETFLATANTEIAYRGLSIDPAAVLHDCMEAAACVAGRGKYGEEYQLYLGGIRSIANHIFGERYSAEKAVNSACKVLYAAASVLVDAKVIEQIEDPTYYLTTDISSSRYVALSRLRKLDAEAFAYLVKTIELLG